MTTRIFSAAPHCRRNGGFSLIEVLVAVAVAGLLAAVAYPAYTDAVRRAKRAEARAALMQLLQQQERYYTQNNRYVEFSVASSDPNAKFFRTYSGANPAGSAYELTGEVCQNETLQTCLKLNAIPGTRFVNASFSDPQCGTLSITTTGVKTASQSGTQCW